MILEMLELLWTQLILEVLPLQRHLLLDKVYALKFASVSGTFTPDEKITQASTGAVGKVVEYDSSNLNTLLSTRTTR